MAFEWGIQLNEIEITVIQNRTLSFRAHSLNAVRFRKWQNHNSRIDRSIQKIPNEKKANKIQPKLLISNHVFVRIQLRCRLSIHAHRRIQKQKLIIIKLALRTKCRKKREMNFSCVGSYHLTANRTKTTTVDFEFPATG